MQKAAHAYLQTQVTTTSQGDLVVLLFDGAINFLNRAKEFIDIKDYAQKGIMITRAIDIIDELDNTLNTSKGGSLAQNLHQLYYSCIKKLVQANIKLDNSIIDEVLNVLCGLRSAFAEILTRPEAQAAAQQVAMTQTSTATSRVAHNLNSAGDKPSQSVVHSTNIRARNMYAQQTNDNTNNVTSLAKNSPKLELTSDNQEETKNKESKEESSSNFMPTQANRDSLNKFASF